MLVSRHEFGHNYRSMLVLLNDNLNSFSLPPAPSFGQMLRHLSGGMDEAGCNARSLIENISNRTDFKVHFT